MWTLIRALSHSDFGYYRPENSSECVEQEEMKRRPLEFCLNGTVEQLQTSGWGSLIRPWKGFLPDTSRRCWTAQTLSVLLCLWQSYRKIPGDQCEGGFQPERKETDLSRICISDFLRADSLVSSSHTANLTFDPVKPHVLINQYLLNSSGLNFLSPPDWVLTKYRCHSDGCHSNPAHERCHGRLAGEEICVWRTVSQSLFHI